MLSYLEAPIFHARYHIINVTIKTTSKIEGPSHRKGLSRVFFHVKSLTPLQKTLAFTQGFTEKISKTD